MGGMGATLGVGLVHTGIMKGFISYAHEDLDLVTDFRKHLAEVECGYDLPFWADDSILAGHDWNDRIAAAIADAHVFLLMLSPSFFNSSYIRTTEIPAIHARLRAIGGLVCPILLIRCPWERQLGNVQVIPPTPGGLPRLLNGVRRITAMTPRATNSTLPSAPISI